MAVSAVSGSTPQPDPGPSMDASRIGFPEAASVMLILEQAHLEPSSTCGLDAMGSGCKTAFQAGTKAARTNVLGVSLVPSGYGSEENHPELAGYSSGASTRGDDVVDLRSPSSGNQANNGQHPEARQRTGSCRSPGPCDQLMM